MSTHRLRIHVQSTQSSALTLKGVEWEGGGGGGEGEEARERREEEGRAVKGGRSASEKERGTAGRENRRGGLQRAEKRPTGVFRRIAARLV